MLKKNKYTEPEICPYFYDKSLCQKDMTLTELVDYCSCKFQNCESYVTIKKGLEKDDKIRL